MLYAEQNECPEQDSNLHVVKHTHLKRARLPIPPPGQAKEKTFLMVYSECWAENGTRTRDPNLGKVVLYQLSYFRKTVALIKLGMSGRQGEYQTVSARTFLVLIAFLNKLNFAFL